MLAPNDINRKDLVLATKQFNNAIDPQYRIKVIKIDTEEDVEKLRDDFVGAIEKADREGAQFHFRQEITIRKEPFYVVTMYERITGKPFPLTYPNSIKIDERLTD